MTQSHNPKTQKILCPECDGTGMVHIAPSEDSQRYDIECPTCEGERFIEIEVEGDA